MGNQWFRMYHEFATDPKVQMLSEIDQRRYVMLLCLRCCNGDVTLHETEIAFQLRISNEEWAKTRAVLMAKNLIDEEGKPTAWDRRQFMSDSSAARVARHRERKKQACNVTETKCNALDTDTDTDTEIRLDKSSLMPGAENGAAPTPTKKAKAVPLPSVIELPLNVKGTYHPVTQADIDEWAELYQAVDVTAELRKMVGWLNANPAKRKTKAGVVRFIVNWLSGQQDKGGTHAAHRQPSQRGAISKTERMLNNLAPYMQADNPG